MAPTAKLRRMLADLDASTDSDAEEACESPRSPRGAVAGEGPQQLLPRRAGWAFTDSDSSSMESSAESEGSGPSLCGRGEAAARRRPAPPPRPAPPAPPASGAGGASSSSGGGFRARPPPRRAAPPPGRAPARPQFRRLPVAPAPPGGSGGASGGARPPGRAPPPKAPPPGGKAAGKGAGGRQLPIGRRLGLRSGRADAEAFQGLWSGEAEGGEVVDLAELRGTFTPKPRAAQGGGKRKARRIELLPRNVAQNVAIILARLTVDPSELAAALETLDLVSVKALPAEDVSRLLDAWPSQEMLEPIVSYVQRGEDPALLRDVERRLLPLASIPRARQRLRLVALVGGLDERVDESLTQLARLQHACSELQVSAAFREILAVVVVLFNYVNFGTEVKRPAASALSGVDVQSLLQLKETKACQGDFPGFHMLHFVLRQLIRQKPELRPRHLCEELASLPRAAQVSLERLRQDLREMHRDRDFVRAELRLLLGIREDAAEERAEDEILTPPPLSRRNLLSMLLGKGLELASFATAWVQGSEVVGQPYHPRVGTSGFEVALAGDGEVPPPGWLWFSRLSGPWHRCWCEIRASVLVIYKVTDNVCKGAIYLALPAAEIRPLDPAGESEDTDKTLCGFEIRSSDGLELRFSAGSQREVDRWLAVLQRQAAVPGAGFLAASPDRGQVLSAYPRRYYCCVVGDELLGFKRPRDGLEGTPPERTWPLEGATVRGLQASASSSSSQSGKRGSLVPFGFEIEDPHSGTLWQFACGSYVEERVWLQALESRPAEGPQGESEAKAAAQETAEEEEEEAVAGAEGQHSADDAGDAMPSDSDSEDGCAEDGPQGLMRYLDRQLSERIGRWERAMVAAETDCRALLRFFGLEVPRHQQLGSVVTNLLEAMSEFVRHARGAWQDLDRHAQAQELRHRAQKRAQKLMHQQTPRQTPRRPRPDQSPRQLRYGTLQSHPLFQHQEQLQKLEEQQQQPQPQQEPEQRHSRQEASDEEAEKQLPSEPQQEHPPPQVPSPMLRKPLLEPVQQESSDTESELQLPPRQAEQQPPVPELQQEPLHCLQLADLQAVERQVEQVLGRGPSADQPQPGRPSPAQPQEQQRRRQLPAEVQVSEVLRAEPSWTEYPGPEKRHAELPLREPLLLPARVPELQLKHNQVHESGSQAQARRPTDTPRHPARHGQQPHQHQQHHRPACYFSLEDICDGPASKDESECEPILDDEIAPSKLLFESNDCSSVEAHAMEWYDLPATCEEEAIARSSHGMLLSVMD